VIDDPEVDAVYVATPTSSHHGYAVAAAAAGKHVLVEKPMGMSAAECDEMVAACGEAGVRLWVAYYRRHLPRFTAVAEALREGRIGRVLATQTTWRDPAPVDRTAWRWDPAQNTGGVFYETACHTLDVLDLLFGPLVDVAGRPSGDLRSVTAAWTHDSGIQGSGTWQYGVPDYREDTVIVGTEGTLTFSSFRPRPIRIVRGDSVTELAVDDPPHVHGPLIAAIVAELDGGPACLSTGLSGARTNRVLDTVIGR
jgi:predicted dehydrogenase